MALSGAYGSGNTNAQGFLEFVAGSVISTANSSNVALADGGSFIGEWEVNGFSDAQTSLLTDVEVTQFYDFSVNGGRHHHLPFLSC